MKNSVLSMSVILLMLISACSTNPFTGKKDFNIVSNSEIFPTAFAQYDTFLKDNKVIKGTSQATMVVNVGQKIKNAAEKYLNANGYKGYLDGYAWEYNLVQNNEINAWCMPGGKIVVYSGILPVTKDEAGLATVLGHEVAHALVNHGAQRMSAETVQQLGAAGLSAATAGKSASAQQLFQQAYGITTQYGAILPFSRKQESEADEIGLTLMAIAGYNPDKAVEFWQRMSASATGAAQPELLSTHPSDATRIQAIKNEVPKAKAEAAKFGVKF